MPVSAIVSEATPTPLSVLSEEEKLFQSNVRRFAIFVASRQHLKFDPLYPAVAASADPAVIARGRYVVRVLANFAQRTALPRVELISIDRFRGLKRFIGLGQLSAQQLASLWPKRKRISRRQLTLGARAWAALRALTPEPLDLTPVRAKQLRGLVSAGIPDDDGFSASERKIGARGLVRHRLP